MAGDDERPKKSWRDIDKQRDGSTHRRERAGAAREGMHERSAAYRSYKSQLDKLFTGGGGGSAEKKAAVQTILDAKSSGEIDAALQTHRAQFGFPDDEEVLIKLLDLGDEGVVREAIDAVAALREQGRLKRAVAIKARLNSVQTTLDDPELRRAAKYLLGLL